MQKFAIILLVAFWAAISYGAASIGNSNLVDAARAQIGVTIRYDPSYQAIDYPNGDVPIDGGVCTDVVVRAMRTARNYDLQTAVHEDMKANFHRYPQIWGLKRPDKNIDHRRVLNLKRFFTRNGWSVQLSNDPSAYKPGDIVTCLVPPNLPHIMIVSDRHGKDDIPLVIHNIGRGVEEANQLFEYKLTGHYRMGGEQAKCDP